ncbi:MAG: 16S rRNA (cytosine(967)-C(5))-methyltransferase RsmB [Gammaproteobacteria bacterium]|nr:16S rRNA (cytosine(967)-C(5))-methyltransferase RsmB [Gammaproteobacteria bacterium]
MSAVGGSTRVTSAAIVYAVVHEGRSLSQAAPAALSDIADERDRAFAQACAFGVLRHYHALKARLATLMPKPLRRKDADLEALLLVGLYQLEHMEVASHAAVSATVDGARELDKDWACGLVNGVLRAALRHAPDANVLPDPRSEFPQWLLDRVRGDWPDDWRSVFANSNVEAPLTLRINQLKTTREAYAALLSEQGIAYTVGRHSRTALRLHEARAVTRLPHFNDGYVSVQDEAAQLAAQILAPQAGERVLDACAAPGGKTAHLLELGGATLDLLALDESTARLARVTENLARLQLHCTVLAGDAGEPSAWWDGRAFDKILLDAPCSALGVMRRHPDIRLRRSAEDVLEVGKQQRRLLLALWPLLAVGGRMLYATCSLLRAENDDVIDSLLGLQPDARTAPLPMDAGHVTRHGRQVLPGEDAMDGFYYCLLIKQPSC